MKRLKALQRWFARKVGYARLLCLALLIGFAFLRILDPAPVQELRVRIFDDYQVIDPRVKTIRPVTIVDIDEPSLARLGQWPWPRTRIADMVTDLTRLGAAVIAFDAVFAEADRLNPDIAADTFRDLDEATREKLKALPSNDRIFADAIRKSRVVLGESGGPDVRADLDKNLPVTGLATLGEEPQPFIFKFPGLLRNVSVLEEAAAGRGLFTIVPERDGIVRRVPMIMQAQGIMMPSLSFEMLRIASGSGTILIKADKAGIKSIGVKGFQLPTDANGQLWVHFAHRDPSIYVSAIDVLEGRVPREKIDRKLVLIGTSSTGLNDIKTTPVSRAMPGVEVHAQVLESALSGAVVSEPNYGIALEFFSAFVMGLLVIAFAPRLGPVTLAGLGALFAAVLVGTSWYFYAHYRLLIDFTYPLLSTTAIYLTLIFFSFVSEQAQRRQIRSAFGQYLSPALVEQLAQAPEKLVLGGEEREMTVMFSDVRGFTTISESYKHDPQGLTRLMNRFLTPLTNAILARKGTIDKYMGDAIMAFWNAPLDDPAHAEHACRAALAMRGELVRLNQDWRDQAAATGQAFHEVKIGIGLNTGECCVGNLGADQKFNYSVIGDDVNLCSRLEGQTKTYGVDIVIGEKTAAEAPAFALLEIDLIRVRGKTRPVHIYALVGDEHAAVDPAFSSLTVTHDAMIAAYRGRRWAEARRHLEASRANAPELMQKFYALYENRIAAFEAEPPAVDWDGVFVALTK